MHAFVGRAAELAELAEITAKSSAGPAAALVIGDPGSGKSRLLAEARARARLPHSFVVVGYEGGASVPLAATAALLRGLTAVPEHGRRVETLAFGSGESSALEPVRLFEAAHRAFRRLEPALLVVDDLQWVDGLSLALCDYLIRAAEDVGQHVAIFAASRPGGSGMGLCDGLAAERVVRMELAPMGREEGIELALAIHAGLDPAVAEELWKRSGGSPFWLEALARAGSSGSGERLLAARLRGATSDAGGVLGTLAVIGRPIAVVGLATFIEWPSARVDNAVGELIRRGLVVEEAGAIRLAHDLIRAVALSELPEDRRRDLHRRFAAQLEREAGDDVRRLREAVEHRRAAGLPTLRLALRLARTPRRTLLGLDGLRLLAAIADEANPFESDALDLQERVALLATELAAHEEALGRWLIVAGQAAEPLRRASALLAASKAAAALERAPEAREYLLHAQQIDDTDDALRLELRTQEAAISLWLEQQTAEGRALARETAATAARLADRSGGVASLKGRARQAYIDARRLESEAALQEGDAEAMLRAAEEREVAARGSDVETYLAASLTVGAGLRLTGRLQEATARFRRVWTDAHRHVLPRLAVDAGYGLARSLQVAAELVEAEQVVLETTELVARAGDVPRGRHRVARIACGVALERGQAREMLRRLEREVVEEANGHQRIGFHTDAALWRARLDGPDAAILVREHLEKGRACTEAAGCPRCGAELLLYSVEALARVGERDNAQRALARWKSLNMRDDTQNDIVCLHAEALAEADARARLAALEAALAAADQTPYALEATWIQLDLGRALAEAGSEEAVGVLERVATLGRDRGAGTVQDLAEQALRSLGVRTWRRGLAGTPLTQREEEVARLVASGATNREIALALFLSTKTVERHVSNALAKLGVRNRAGLASRIHEAAPGYAASDHRGRATARTTPGHEGRAPASSLRQPS